MTIEYMFLQLVLLFCGAGAPIIRTKTYSRVPEPKPCLSLPRIISSLHYLFPELPSPHIPKDFPNSRPFTVHKEVGPEKAAGEYDYAVD